MRRRQRRRRVRPSWRQAASLALSWPCTTAWTRTASAAGLRGHALRYHRAAPTNDVQVGLHVPRSRNTRIRPKNTSRAEARRRHRDETARGRGRAQRASSEARWRRPRSRSRGDPRSAFAMPERPRGPQGPAAGLPQAAGVAALRPAAAHLRARARALRAAADLPEGQVARHPHAVHQLTLPPDHAVRLLHRRLRGAARLLPRRRHAGRLRRRPHHHPGGPCDQAALEGSTAITEVDAARCLRSSRWAPLWGIGLLVGVFAGGFAAWYRRFLRSSQERAAAQPRCQGTEQARKAKEQARADKQAAREARRKDQ